MVTKLDRLERSLPDARDIADELTRHEVKLDLGGNVHNPTDPAGRLLFNWQMAPSKCSLRSVATTVTRWSAIPVMALGLPRVLERGTDLVHQAVEHSLQLRGEPRVAKRAVLVERLVRLSHAQLVVDHAGSAGAEDRADLRLRPDGPEEAGAGSDDRRRLVAQ